MGTTSEDIKQALHTIVLTYTRYIRDRVKSGDKDLIDLGVDSDFKIYEKLFKSVISKSLGIKLDEILEGEVVDSCVEELSITFEGFKKLVDNPVMSEFIYDLCLIMLEKVKEEEFPEPEFVH